MSFILFDRIKVDYEANDISGFNAIVSKNGLSIHGVAQPVLVAQPRATARSYAVQRSPLNRNLLVAYGNLQQQIQQSRTPASTVEYIAAANNQFLPYNSIAYGFNGEGSLW